MSYRHKIALQSNGPWQKTGLAENSRHLLNWLAKRDKYDLVALCTQVSEADGNLSRMPYRCRGMVPANLSPAEQQRCMADGGFHQQVAYGILRVDRVIKEEKPSIWIGSDDVWSFIPEAHSQTEWFKKINAIMHITVDSVPIAPMAYEQALATKHYLTWAKFGAKEMRRQGPQYSHVDSIYGASDISKFRPINVAQRADLRKQMGLDPRDTIFLMLGRNQLRKSFLEILEAFAQFRKENPNVRAKLLFHTHWVSGGGGADIPRLREYLKIPREDVLATMVCHNCKRWEVKPYDGEGKDCRFCGAQKAQHSANGVTEGVPDDEMYMLYGVADAMISAFTSGGLEYTNVQSLLCGLPLACTNYSCGEDFCEQPFVTPIKWTSRYEVHTSFRKASNDIGSIKGFMEKITRMPQRDRDEIGEKGRDWAAREFSIETIGAKWEKLFDSMTPPDWSSITVEYKPKNDRAPNPEITDPGAWVTALYSTILNVQPDPDGFKHWLGVLERGTPRDQVYQFFLGRAREDNQKNAAPQDFGDLLDRENGKKRALIVIKESLGDCLMVTQLLESFHRQYPNHDLYIGTEPRHFEVFDGNSLVKKCLPYQPFMEQEMAMIGAGQREGYFHLFFHAAALSQRILGYLSPNSIAHNLAAK